MVSKKAKQRWANTYRGRQADLPIDDIGHLDIRVGVVRDMIPNPNLPHKYHYLAVNFGDIFSKIVPAMFGNAYEEDEVIGKMVVCCCNFRAPWVRVIDSWTHIIVASPSDTGIRFEPLSPPDDAVPGDIINVKNYPRNPATPYINPKGGIWEAIQENTKVNDKGEVEYKSQTWFIENKLGVVHTNQVTNAYIRLI